MNLIDTHCHLNFESYADERDAVLARAADVGVRRVINPGIDPQSSREGVGLAVRYAGRVFAAVGLHPNSTADFAPALLADEIAPLLRAPGVVAVGEIGLDYYWDKSPKDVQRRAFVAQLTLARDAGLPVIIHSRDAGEDVIAILEDWARDLPTRLHERCGVLHSFSASQQIAERALEAGFYLGFTGPITYKNADDLRRVAAAVPLERMLLETDGPFLTPEPHRGKRNEPAYIPLIARRIATLTGLNTEAVAETTTANAVELFNLPPLTA